jgi:hypothetical protein
MPERYDAEMQKLYNELVKNRSEDGQINLPIVCPTTFNKPCRLCDLAKNILFKKDNEGTPIRAKASELNRKKSYYSNVIFPTNPSEIVVFQYGDKVWKELMLWSMGPASEVKDWLDPKTGRNVIITKTTVAGNKRRTDYSTKSRINSTPLLDMAVLRKLSQPEYQLDNILELIKAGTVKPFYQSGLQDGANELRFLPSWLGPGITKFFQLVLYHYGVTEEDFEMIQKGELNPFSGVDYGERAQTEPHPIQREVQTQPKPVDPAGSLWDQYIKEVPRGVTTAKTESLAAEAPAAYPPCFGKKWDANDTECTEDCNADGWAEPCKTAFEAVQRTALDKRKIAKRLIR